MKKVLLFVLTIALVSSLSASIGCGGKKSDTKASTPEPTKATGK